VGLKGWYSSQESGVKTAILAAAVTGTLAVVAATVTGVFSVISSDIDHPGQTPVSKQSPVGAVSSASTSSRPSPSATSSCTPGLSLTAPANNTYIPNGGKGIEVEGTFCELGNNSAWLFDWDSQDKHYYADYNSADPSPLTMPAQGDWHFKDKPIGNPGDNQKKYIITLVSASPACNQELLQSPSIANSNRILRFPAGCKIVDQRIVYVSYP
jgi:hypothetical protein